MVIEVMMYTSERSLSNRKLHFELRFSLKIKRYGIQKVFF